jgi:hypothetical protein
VNEFSQTQFLIKNALNGSPIHREIPCHYSSTREGKLFQKALKSCAQRNQTSYRLFFVAAENFAGLESPESILHRGQCNRIVLRCTHKFLVNVFALVSFETEIFDHHSLFDSIYSNIRHVREII